MATTDNTLIYESYRAGKQSTQAVILTGSSNMGESEMTAMLVQPDKESILSALEEALQGEGTLKEITAAYTKSGGTSVILPGSDLGASIFPNIQAFKQFLISSPDGEKISVTDADNIVKALQAKGQVSFETYTDGTSGVLEVTSIT